MKLAGRSLVAGFFGALGAGAAAGGVVLVAGYLASRKLRAVWYDATALVRGMKGGDDQ